MAKKTEGAVPSEVQPAYALWSRGDVLRARQEARRVLAAGPSPEARQLAERLLRDTAPDQKIWMTAVGALVVVAVVLILLALRK
ncbi:MAG: molecular chaperone DnaJ [Deltaproteobacteria bacterium]